MLADAMSYVQRLLVHRPRPGFDHFVEGWRNGPQLQNSLAELTCVEFLTKSKSHRDYSFGPFVDGVFGKRADVLWRNSRGAFLVEVKSLRMLHKKRAASGFVVGL